GGDGGIAGGPDSGPCAVACALSNCRTTCAASTQKCRTGCMLGSYAYCKCKVKPAWFAYGFLSGKFAVPATPSTASAAAVLLYNSSTGVLTYELRVNGASATAAHLHQGGFGLNGAQLVTLSGGPTVFSGTTTLSPSFVTDMLVEGLYLDVHSAAFPNGELRGQVRIDSSFGAELAPSNVVPPAASSAKGYARMRYAPNKTFEFTVEVSGTTATLAHIHAGDVGVSGPVIATLPLIAPNKFSGQTGVLTDSMLVAILTEGCYVDVHSAAFPNGELRDQLLVGGLNANAEAVSVANGGVVDIELAAKASAAGKLYLILGSTSGTAPGVPTSAGTLPLQPDAYFNFTLGSPNVPPLARSLGTLDGGGATWATLTIPAGWPATLAGLQVHHAAVVIDLATLAVEWISGFERVVLIA
ncbi:MAG: CHRD domain-containing protein, partial [Planctomycetota bacterium]